MMLKGIANAMTRYAARQPRVWIRNWTKGIKRKIPTPIPEEMIPMASPLFSLNQFWMTVVFETHPVEATPMAVTMLKNR